MRYLLILFLLFAAVAARSEQRVIAFATSVPQAGNVDIPQMVSALLARGYTIKHVSTSSGGYANGYMLYLVIFVLESPAPIQSPIPSKS